MGRPLLFSCSQSFSWVEMDKLHLTSSQEMPPLVLVLMSVPVLVSVQVVSPSLLSHGVGDRDRDEAVVGMLIVDQVMLDKYRMDHDSISEEVGGMGGILLLLLLLLVASSVDVVLQDQLQVKNNDSIGGTIKTISLHKINISNSDVVGGILRRSQLAILVLGTIRLDRILVDSINRGLLQDVDEITAK